MHDIRNQKVPSDFLNLLSDTTSIYSYKKDTCPVSLKSSWYIRKTEDKLMGQLEWCHKSTAGT